MINAGNIGATGYTRSAADLYCSPRWLVPALLDHVPITGTVWEPTAGHMDLVEPLTDAGLIVNATDLHDYGISATANVDFLTCAQIACDWIVMNPPFNLSDAFVRRALDIATVGVACVLRLNWIAAKKRADLASSLSHLIILGRVPFLPPGAVDKGISPTTDYAWCVWNTGHKGPTTITRGVK